MLALTGGQLSALIIMTALGIGFALVRWLRHQSFLHVPEKTDHRMLYPDMTVSDAELLLDEWKVMSENERDALPDEARARIDQIRKDLAAYHARPDSEPGGR